jgi:opacity protein-like surface antigen
VTQLRALTLGLTFILLAALPAVAEDNEYNREGSYLGIGGLYALENASGNWSGAGDTGGLGFTIGYRMVPQMSWEFGGSWLDQFTFKTGEDVAVGTMTVAARIYLVELFDRELMGGRLQPYAVGNGGVMIGRIGGDAQIGGAFGGGVGTDYYVTPNWVVNANVQYYANKGDFDNLQYVGFMLGAMYRF